MIISENAKFVIWDSVWIWLNFLILISFNSQVNKLGLPITNIIWPLSNPTAYWEKLELIEKDNIFWILSNPSNLSLSEIISPVLTFFNNFIYFFL